MRSLVIRLFHYDDMVVVFMEEIEEVGGKDLFVGNDRVRVSKHSLFWKRDLRKRLLAWWGHPIEALTERTLQYCVCKIPMLDAIALTPSVSKSRLAMLCRSNHERQCEKTEWTVQAGNEKPIVWLGE